MADPIGRIRTLLAELKRRKVYRVGLVYLVVAVASLEFMDVIVPASSLPDWSEEFFLSLAVLGFPMALVLAWAFEITPDGVRRTVGWGGEEGEAARSAGVAAVPGPGDAGRHPDHPATPAMPASGSPDASQTGSPTHPSLDERTVAVLPFTNMSGTIEAEPFAAGLHDDLLTELSQRSGLTIISRTSVVGYVDSGKSVPAIARELGAGTVVEGGVQMVGDRVRLNIQVIDGRTDVHRWAERYDRKLTASDIFDLQTELARKIAETVRAELDEAAPEPGGPPTENLEAYRQFASGRERFAQRTEEGMKAAADHFDRAIEADPSYAQAWAGLANSLTLLVDYRHVDSDEMLPRAREAAQRALSLNPELAQAHAAMGNLSSCLREGNAAVRHHERAIQLQPSYAGAHLWLCWVHLLLGNPARAVEAGERATRLDPLDPEGRTNLAMAYLGCRRPADALAEARRVLAQNADFDYARWAEGLALEALGQEADAASAMSGLTERWARVWPDTTRALGALRDGNVEAAREGQVGLADSNPFHAGVVGFALGDADQGLAGISSALPLAWDEVLALRYGPGVLARIRASPDSRSLFEALDLAWGGDGDSLEPT